MGYPTRENNNVRKWGCRFYAAWSRLSVLQQNKKSKNNTRLVWAKMMCTEVAISLLSATTPDLCSLPLKRMEIQFYIFLWQPAIQLKKCCSIYHVTAQIFLWGNCTQTAVVGKRAGLEESEPPVSCSHPMQSYQYTHAVCTQSCQYIKIYLENCERGQGQQPSCLKWNFVQCIM